MVQLISVLVAILLIALVITTDRDSEHTSKSSSQSVDARDYYNDTPREPKKRDSFFSFIKDDRVITFDLYQIKGKGVLNIDRRSFREGLKNALEDSNKFKLGYNPNIKMVLTIKEDIIRLNKYIAQDYDGNERFVVKKRVKVVVEYALFKDSRVTYHINNLTYRADLKASSPINYDDAIHKINKRLYWIVAKKVSAQLVENYKSVLNNL
jgi:hypothetical protein